MKTVVVTGGGGYIGNILVPKLLKNGYAVRSIDRFFFGSDLLKADPNLTLIQEDCRKLNLDHLDGAHAVIDLVAISNDPSGELFSDATWAINHESRVHTATMAKEKGVKRYILPSSCSIYGFTDEIVTEESKTNPLTVYARANEKAEKGVLPLADDKFTVTVMRQATVFGYSPRMRFDLAINGMSYGAWETRNLPLMRDGNQYRPMVHVQDTTDVMLKLLTTDPGKISGHIFNVGSDQCNYQIGQLGEIVAEIVSKKLDAKVGIEWYGDPDHRSYRADFSKVETTLDWKAQWDAERGVGEIVDALERGEVKKTDRTITLDWYRNLVEWHQIIKSVEKYGGILDIN